MHGGYFQKHLVIPLYVIGLQRIKDFPNVPTVVELAPNDLDRAIMRILATMPAIGTTIVAPPGVPQDRVEALRQAVDKIARNPGFKSDMGKINMELDPLSGPKVAKLVSQSCRRRRRWSRSSRISPRRRIEPRPDRTGKARG